MSDDQLSELRVNDLTAAVQSLLQKIIAELKSTASAEKAGEERLFFPHGIELISLTVKVPPADVELTIAGEKGIKHNGPGLHEADSSSHHDRDVDDDGDSEAMRGGDVITWHNRHGFPVRITFDNPSPLDCRNPFTIPKKDDVDTIILASASGPYPYHLERYEKGRYRRVAGDPRIIIQ